MARGTPPDCSERRIVPLFRHDSGRIFGPTARRVWDLLLSESVAPHRYLIGAAASEIWAQLNAAALDHFQSTASPISL